MNTRVYYYYTHNYNSIIDPIMDVESNNFIYIFFYSLLSHILIARETFAITQRLPKFD